MLTNLIVLVTGGLILFDQAGWIEDVSYVWLAVMFIGWGFLKTAHDIGAKKKKEQEQQKQMEDFLQKLLLTIEAMEDSNKSEKH